MDFSLLLFGEIIRVVRIGTFAIYPRGAGGKEGEGEGDGGEQVR